jgi:hypothetical protein
MTNGEANGKGCRNRTGSFGDRSGGLAAKGSLGDPEPRTGRESLADRPVPRI